jgi:HlyD family secretion protein
MSLKKKILPIIIGVFTIIFTLWLFFGRVEVTAMKIENHDAVKGVTVTGNVKSTQDANITAQVTARINQIYVESGEYVKKGQILATLEGEEERSGVDAAQANFNAAQAELQNLRTEPRLQRIQIAGSQVTEIRERVNAFRQDLKKQNIDLLDAKREEERYSTLYKEGAVSKRNLEEKILAKQKIQETMQGTKADIQAAEAQVAQAKENLNLTIEGPKKEELEASQARLNVAKFQLNAAKQRFNYFTIKAPVSGYIAEKFVSPGDLSSPQKPLFRIVTPENIYLGTDVEENQLDQIKLGQKALIIFDAYPDKVYEGKVYLVSKQVNPATGTFEARITKPPDKNIKLLVGMTLDATIIISQLKDVMIISSNYVTKDENKTYVSKKDGLVAKKTPVKIQFFDNNRVMVIQGLKEGDIIVKSLKKSKLGNNTRIKIVEYQKP